MRIIRGVRSGFTLIELLIVIAILSVLFYRFAPALSEIGARSALRTSRQALTTVFAAARAAAMQKGRTATLTLTSTSASVTVLSSVDGATVTLVGPISLTGSRGAVLTALGNAPTTVTFDGRGLISPATAAINRYQLSSSRWSDTVCVSGAGIILMRGCQL